MVRLFIVILICYYSSLGLADGVPDGCGNPVKTCIQPGGTKTFAGVPVTLPCWQYKETYTCGIAPVDTCTPLEKTCKVGSVAKCLAQIEGLCVETEYTYECPTQRCDSHSLYCGHDVFCLDGNCVKKTPTTNQHFGNDSSELAVTFKAAQGAATQQNNKQTISLFNGHAKECSIAILNYQDCCKDSGWSKDISLNSCSDDEKKLGKDKEHYLATYIGEYCHNSVLGVCTSEHKVYCVFDSKMARIVEDYGRAQLHKSYGGPQSPNCSGFSLNEFQKLNFNSMDFVDPIYIYPDGSHNHAAGIADDMKINGPSAKDMANAINKRIHDDINNDTPSSDKRNNVDTQGLANALAAQVGAQ